MKKLSIVLLLTLLTVSCSNQTPKIQKWDNTKYEHFESSFGIDVFNEHSDEMEKEEEKRYKENNTLFISDLSKPITVKFNNNGKNRDFVMGVYYDYEPIHFKVGKMEDYDQKYLFSLKDGYEMELPLYLPIDLKKSDAHKLMITFSAGPEVHAKDFNQSIGWYGATTLHDVIFDSNRENFSNPNNYTKSEAISEFNYDYALNQDYDYSVAKTGIMPVTPTSIKVKPKENFHLIYNVSSPSRKKGTVLLLTTIGFNHVPINGEPYLLVQVPEKGTVSGEIMMTAPEKPGLYEIISYSVSNPFKKYQGNNLSDFLIEAAPRFTLEVEK